MNATLADPPPWDTAAGHAEPVESTVASAPTNGDRADRDRIGRGDGRDRPTGERAAPQGEPQRRPWRGRPPGADDPAARRYRRAHSLPADGPRRRHPYGAAPYRTDRMIGPLAFLTGRHHPARTTAHTGPACIGRMDTPLERPTGEGAAAQRSNMDIAAACSDLSIPDTHRAARTAGLSSNTDAPQASPSLDSYWTPPRRRFHPGPYPARTTPRTGPPLPSRMPPTGTDLSPRRFLTARHRPYQTRPLWRSLPDAPPAPQAPLCTDASPPTASSWLTSPLTHPLMGTKTPIGDREQTAPPGDAPPAHALTAPQA